MESSGLTKITFPQYKGYNEFLDDAGNKVYQNKRTGKLVPCHTVDIPLGGRVLTPEQVERGEEIKAGKHTRECNRRLSFYFVLSKDRKQDAVKAQTLARVFFLATYLRSDDNRLYSNEGNLLKKSDLAELMQLSSASFKRFWKDANGKYIFENDDSSISVSDEFFRGTLAGRTKADDSKKGYQQVYIRSLRELYLQTDVTKHRYLGYLFMILHQINYEHNILCWNPEEKDRNKIETMSLDDFCRSMGADGYTENQRNRLLDAYRKLRFTVGKTQQYVVAYLEDYVSKKLYLVVNPNLLYRGHNREKIDGYGVFFPSVSE